MDPHHRSEPRVQRKVEYKTDGGAEISSFCCHQPHLHLVVFTKFLVERFILYSSISLRFNNKKMPRIIWTIHTKFLNE